MDHAAFTKVRSAFRAFAKGNKGVNGAFNKTNTVVRTANPKNDSKIINKTALETIG